MIAQVDRKIDTLPFDQFSTIFISHEGTFTGAPIVLSNIIKLWPLSLLVITFGDESVFDLNTSSSVYVLKLDLKDRTSFDAGFYLAEYILSNHNLSKELKIICGSSVAANFLCGFNSKIGAKALLLLHECSHYFTSFGALSTLMPFSKVVFSSEYVKKSWTNTLDDIMPPSYFDENFVKLPQPMQTTPLLTQTHERQLETLKFRKTLRIVSVAHFQERKGPEYFIAICINVAKKLQSDSDCLFSNVYAQWIGFPRTSTSLSAYIISLARQAERDNENIVFNFQESSTSYHDAIDLADIFICPSTIDPLPNIVYESLYLETPTYVLDDCNGHAEYFKKSNASNYVLQHDNIEKSAQIIIDNIKIKTSFGNLAKKILNLFPSHEEYVNSIYSYIQTKPELKDSKAIGASNLLDKNYSSFFRLLAKRFWNCSNKNQTFATFYLHSMLVKRNIQLLWNNSYESKLDSVKTISFCKLLGSYLNYSLESLNLLSNPKESPFVDVCIYGSSHDYFLSVLTYLAKCRCMPLVENIFVISNSFCLADYPQNFSKIASKVHFVPSFLSCSELTPKNSLFIMSEPILEKSRFNLFYNDKGKFTPKQSIFSEKHIKLFLSSIINPNLPYLFYKPSPLRPSPAETKELSHLLLNISTFLFKDTLFDKFFDDNSSQPCIQIPFNGEIYLSPAIRIILRDLCVFCPKIKSLFEPVESDIASLLVLLAYVVNFNVCHFKDD